jgi:hypothetical protein
MLQGWTEGWTDSYTTAGFDVGNVEFSGFVTTGLESTDLFYRNDHSKRFTTVKLTWFSATYLKPHL